MSSTSGDSISSDYAAIHPAGRHLCCSFPIPLALFALSLLQGVASDTPHKRPLQSDYQRLLDLKLLDVKLQKLLIITNSQIFTASTPPDCYSSCKNVPVLTSSLIDIQ
jgi:hypothetical protein